MTVNEFVNRFVDKPSDEVGYLAQYQLLEQIPQLRSDLVVPDYCYFLEEEGTLGNGNVQKKRIRCAGNEDADNFVDINCWFGPAHTVSPMHTDPRHNLLAQVCSKQMGRN